MLVSYIIVVPHTCIILKADLHELLLYIYTLRKLKEYDTIVTQNVL